MDLRRRWSDYLVGESQELDANREVKARDSVGSLRVDRDFAPVLAFCCPWLDLNSFRNPIFCWYVGGCRKNVVFLQKTSCSLGHRSVDTPSPAAQRCTIGAPDGPQGNETQEQKTEIDEAGRAKKLRRTQLILSLPLFEIASY